MIHQRVRKRIAREVSACGNYAGIHASVKLLALTAVS